MPLASQLCYLQRCTAELHHSGPAGKTFILVPSFQMSYCHFSEDAPQCLTVTTGWDCTLKLTRKVICDQRYFQIPPKGSGFSRRGSQCQRQAGHKVSHSWGIADQLLPILNILEHKNPLSHWVTPLRRLQGRRVPRSCL